MLWACIFRDDAYTNQKSEMFLFVAWFFIVYWYTYFPSTAFPLIFHSLLSPHLSTLLSIQCCNLLLVETMKDPLCFKVSDQTIPKLQHIVQVRVNHNQITSEPLSKNRTLYCVRPVYLYYPPTHVTDQKPGGETPLAALPQETDSGEPSCLSTPEGKAYCTLL